MLIGQTKRFEAIRAASLRRPHGTRARYVAGCRCLPCRASNSRYETARSQARADGDWNGIVPAVKAQQHLVKLSAEGIGRRTVADVSGISQTILAAVKSGRRKNIRRRTEQAILSVTSEAAGAGNLVDAGPARKMVGWLLAEGFSRAEIARRLGLKTHALQFLYVRSGMVTGRTEARIRKFYNIVRMGE